MPVFDDAATAGKGAGLGDLTFAHEQALVDVLVSDDAIRTAVRWLPRKADLVVEPSGAARQRPPRGGAVAARCRGDRLGRNVETTIFEAHGG